MKDAWLILPVILQFILTFIIQTTLYQRRKDYLIKNNVSPNIMKLRKSDKDLPDNIHSASDNFKNQFEIPVIFYATIAFLIILGGNNWIDFYLAFGFVIMRIVHATIQITHNRVRYRFYAYIIGTFILWGLVARLTVSWIQHIF